MSEVSFVALGGANSIGRSRYLLKFPGCTVAVDWGAAMDTVIEEDEDPVDVVIVTHGHFDHAGAVPVAFRGRPKLRVLATPITQLLSKWLWSDTRYVANQHGRPDPFSREEETGAANRMESLPLNVPVALSSDVSVTAFRAGHILGAVMLVFTYREESYVFTGDMCLHNHPFVPGAEIPRLERCRLLVRESTYVGQWAASTREDEKAKLISVVTRILNGGGRVVIPTLSIDRLPEIWVALHDAEVDHHWPVWVAGGRIPSEIYRDYAKGGKVLRHMERFANSQVRAEALRAGRPMVILASSGMMALDTPSYECATRILEDSSSAILFVNWQNLSSPGGLILHGNPDEQIELPWGSYRRSCTVQSFQLTTHAMEDEMGQLEANIKPELVVHVHGNDREIQSFVDSAYGRRRQRHKAEVRKEIQLL